MKGIKSNVHQREGVFMFPNCHQQFKNIEKNPRDKLLMVDLEKISSPKFVNIQRSDYNKGTICVPINIVEVS
jgi:hypothetical protein